MQLTQHVSCSTHMAMMPCVRHQVPTAVMQTATWECKWAGPRFLEFHFGHFTEALDRGMSHDFAVQGDGQPLKSCPMCRQPLGQIMRYGRPLNKMTVDHADIKFFIHCSRQLLEADNLFNAANKAFATSSNRAGMWGATFLHA